MAEKELSIKQNMLWNSVGSMVYLGCQWLITVLVVRLSSSFDAAGALALAMAVSNIFSPVGQYKVRPFQVSDVDGEFTSQQYVGHRILSIAISVIVMLVYGFATCDQAQLSSVFLYGVYSLGPIFSDVLQGEQQRMGRMDIIGIALILRGVLSLSSFALFMYFSQVLDIALLAMTVTTFLEIALFEMPKTRALVGALRPDFSKEKMLALFKTCAPAVIALFFCSAVPSVPRQVLSSLHGADSLGIYASIAAPVLIVQMGAQYVYSPMLTEFARRFHQASARSFIGLLLKVTAAITGIGVAGVVGFALVGPILLEIIYGNGISAYSYVLTPLVVCTVLTAYIWFIGDLLIVVRDMSGNLFSYAIAMVVCVLTMNPLVSAWGMNGVSYSVIAAYSAALVFAAVRMTQKIKQHDASGDDGRT